jgi:hypothetical protein
MNSVVVAAINIFILSVLPYYFIERLVITISRVDMSEARDAYIGMVGERIFYYYSLMSKIKDKQW